jgi:hypothetical protein
MTGGGTVIVPIIGGPIGGIPAHVGHGEQPQAIGIAATGAHVAHPA